MHDKLSGCQTSSRREVIPLDDGTITAAYHGIDICREHLVRLADVPKHLPPNANGNHIHKSGPFRWASKGLKGHKLEFIQIAGVRFTSQEALQRFFDQLTVGGTTLGSDVPVKRQNQITQAELDIKQVLARRRFEPRAPNAEPIHSRQGGEA